MCAALETEHGLAVKKILSGSLGSLGLQVPYIALSAGAVVTVHTRV